jgi:hypothetical protein
MMPGLRADGSCSRCGGSTEILYRITRDNPLSGMGPEPLDAERFCGEQCIGEWYTGITVREPNRVIVRGEEWFRPG